MKRSKIDLDQEVWTLNLPVRALTCLQNAGIQTIRQLCLVKRADLLKYRNFGKMSMTWIDERLDEHHLSTNMTEEELKLYKYRIFADCEPQNH